MRIGITGGLGFIGSNLTNRFLDDGHEIVILDDLSTGLEENLKQANYRFIKGSILDRSSVVEFLENVEFVFHLAARGSVPRSFQDQASTFEVNTIGSVILLEEARLRSIPIVLTSSSSVFGSTSQGSRSETDAKKPISPYAVSKFAMEIASQVNRETYSQKSLVVRLFNVFGPYQRSDHDYAAVIPKWIKAATDNKSLSVFGDGLQSRDFTYVKDVVDVFARIIDMPEIFDIPELNVGFGRPVTLREIIQLLKIEFPSLEVEYLEARTGDIHRSMNNSKLLSSIFPNLKITPLTQALVETIDWSRKF